MQDDNRETKIEIDSWESFRKNYTENKEKMKMSSNNRETEIEIKCVLGVCTKKATKKYYLTKNKYISVCLSCYNKLLDQQEKKWFQQKAKMSKKLVNTLKGEI